MRVKKTATVSVKSELILRTAGAFIMDMEYANDSSHSSKSEAEELNTPTLVLPYQFEPPASSCLQPYTTQLTASRAAIQMIKIL